MPEVEFRAQVTHLRDQYRVMPLDDLSQAVAAGAVPDGAISLTFDDGYLDNYATVSPILTELELPATFFITTECLDQPEPYEFWWDVLADSLLNPERRYPSALELSLSTDDRRFKTTTGAERRKAHDEIYGWVNESPPDLREQAVTTIATWSGRRPFSEPSLSRMSADQVIRLAHRPGHTIGAHSVRHLMLPRQSQSVQHTECAQSKSDLERFLGTPVTTFAYPYGAFDESTVGTVQSVGFQVAVTCEAAPVDRTSDRLRLPRLEVTPGRSSAFEAWVATSLVAAARRE
jgi:peptidoglycan/xylan/chitin deacetylase (PgdA/CDA1 family)